MSHGLLRLGPTQQRLLRQLLLSGGGCTVEDLCLRLKVTHNAVRQHLTALMAAGHAERVETLATGGRPQQRYAITPQGRELFPRNYGAIAGALLNRLESHLGPRAVAELLVDLGTSVAASQPALPDTDGEEALARALAERLDSLGYEALPARAAGEWQVEAFNCVFHGLARQNPQVCQFDLAYLRAVSGRDVALTACMLHGEHVCRFRFKPASAEPAESQHEMGQAR
jgi:predicted ArsR family transcriptional regulator